MHDDLVSRGAVVAILLWVVAFALVALTWGMAFAGAPLKYEGAVGLTSILHIAVASVWHIKLGQARLAALVRVGSGLNSPDAEVHSLSRR